MKSSCGHPTRWRPNSWEVKELQRWGIFFFNDLCTCLIIVPTWRISSCIRLLRAASLRAMSTCCCFFCGLLPPLSRSFPEVPIFPLLLRAMFLSRVTSLTFLSICSQPTFHTLSLTAQQAFETDYFSNLFSHGVKCYRIIWFFFIIRMNFCSCFYTIILILSTIDTLGLWQRLIEECVLTTWTVTLKVSIYFPFCHFVEIPHFPMLCVYMLQCV